MSFPSSAARKFLDLPPVNLRNLHLHRTKNPFAGRPPHLCGVALKKRGEGERVERKYLLLGECDAKREVCALCEAICPLEDKEPSDDRCDFSSRQGHRRAQFVPAVRTIRPDGKNHTETGGLPNARRPPAIVFARGRRMGFPLGQHPADEAAGMITGRDTEWASRQSSCA